MGTKYPGSTISGYNTSPPSDDGTESEANKVKWSTIKTKITDPIKTLAEAINTALNTHFNKGPTAIVTATTLGPTHYNQVIEASGTSEITLTAASTLTAGWFCDIINKGSGTIPLLRAEASDTIDGTSSDTNIYAGETMRVIVNAAANGFITSVGMTTDADGTWTPAISGVSGGAGAYNTQTGYYCKLGNIVFIEGHINMSGNGTLTTSDGAMISGLPFAMKGYPVINMYATGLSITDGDSLVARGSGITGTTLTIGVYGDAGGVTIIQIAELDAPCSIYFSGHYFI